MCYRSACDSQQVSNKRISPFEINHRVVDKVDSSTNVIEYCAGQYWCQIKYF